VLRSTDIRELTASNQGGFKNRRHTQQAVAYNLAVLGEAARSLSPAVRKCYPRLPWRQIIAQRNSAVREYHRLEIALLWATATSNLPQLDQQLAAIEEAERKDAARQAES
jgi:uncharacterized protein with HEPN domain